MKEVRPSLKDLIADTVMVRKLVTYDELEELAIKNGYKPETATRRLRGGDGWDIPVIKLNAKKKPIKESERIYYYKWCGGKTIFN